jgi:molybdopterin-containing oxidoreductase family membrane subunit
MFTKLFQPKQLYPFWLTLLGLLMIGGIAGASAVFAKGLVVTGLSDSVPWGLWIALDLSSIAVSAGAFSLSAIVYLLEVKRLQPLARVAVFIGLIGYSMAMLALVLDIGRPDRFWHALVFWNPHSVLWEVTMCIMLYFSVLLVEFAPLLGESAWLQKLSPRWAPKLAALHHAAPALAVAGLCLSLLHQSSLGAMYGIIKARPIWFKPDMAILFILSAVAAGQALTVFASVLINKLRGQELISRDAINLVAKFIGFTLLAYLYLRFWDFMALNYTNMPGRTEGLNLLSTGLFQWNVWLGEIALGGFIPVILLLWGRTRQNDWALMSATMLVVIGVVLSRFDINLAGLLLNPEYVPNAAAAAVSTYTPTWVEWATTLGVMAYGLLAFTLGVKYLPVFTHEAPEPEEEKFAPRGVTI